MRSADGDLLALGPEIPSINGIGEFRQASRTLPRGQTYDARQCVSAVQNAVWSAQDFNLINSGGREIPEFDTPADVVDRNPVQRYFVGVRIPSAHKQICGSTARAGLEHLNTRNDAKRFVYVQLFRQGHVANDCNRCADLRVECGSSGRRYAHLLGYGSYLQRKNDVGSFLAADVYVGALLLGETRRHRAHSVAPSAQ